MWRTLLRFKDSSSRFNGMYLAITEKYDVEMASITSFYITSDEIPAGLIDRLVEVSEIIEVRVTKNVD